MLNHLRSAFIYHQFMRRGNTLLITLMTVVLVVGLVSLSSEHLSSGVKLEKINDDRQRAQNAAESMMAILEKNLIDKAKSATSSLQVDLGLDKEKWFGRSANELDALKQKFDGLPLVGFDYGYRLELDANGDVVKDTSGNAKREFKPAIKPLYFNGCAIRWRIEPVKLMNHTVTDVTASGQGIKYFVNSERDQSLQEERRDAAGTDLMADEAKHFYYRLVVEAYALQNPQERYSADSIHAPWALTDGKPDEMAQRYSHKVQAQRVIELQDTNPFLYLIYYKSDDNTGDLEIDPTGSLEIKIGSIRTNNRMFFSTPAGSIAIGTGAVEEKTETDDVPPKTINPPLLLNRPVKIESAKGIYRLSKTDAYDREVTVIGEGTDNGERSEEGTVALNGVGLTTENDTRSNAELSDFIAGVVKGGVPADMNYFSNSTFMEPIHRVGPGVPYYKYNSDGTFSLKKQDRPGAAYVGEEGDEVVGKFATGMLLFRFAKPGNDSDYYTDIYPHINLPAVQVDLEKIVDTSGVNLGNRQFQITPKVDAVYGDKVPVETENGTVWVRGPLITPEEPEIIDYDTPTPSVMKIDTNTGNLTSDTIKAATNCLKMPKVPQKGYKYSSTDPVPHYQGDYASVIGAYSTSNRTGLLIRERGARTPLGGLTYNNWMRANYVVYLGKKLERIKDNAKSKVQEEARLKDNDNWINVDITDEFFDYSALSSDLMLREDDFINGREGKWQETNLTVNALTINLGRVQEFLMQNVLQTTESNKFQSGGQYHKYFNGKIYLERTNQYNAAKLYLGGPAPCLDPLAPNGYHLGGGKDAAALTAIVGNVDDGEMPLAIGAGDWTVYPSTKVIRISNAAEIKELSKDIKGLGIYSAQTCYIWGNFNTNNRQSTSIYADSMAALSNEWVDNGEGLKTAGSNMIINAAIVTNNVPTDLKNSVHGGSGGVQNIFRFLENWSGKTFSFKGGIIVSGRANYTRSPIYSQEFHTPPNMKFTYDERLESTAGQPLSSPKSTDKKRVFAVVSQ